MGDREAMQNNHTKLNTIIILLVAIFFSMVGIATGYFINRPSIPKYVFTPEYIAYKKKDMAYKIVDTKVLQQLKSDHQTHKVYIRNILTSQIGDYLVKTNGGFSSKTKKSFTHIELQSDEFPSFQIGSLKLPFSYATSSKNKLADRIDTEKELEIIMDSKDFFKDWGNRLKVGNYVVYNKQNNDAYKEKYHILNSKKYEFKRINP